MKSSDQNKFWTHFAKANWEKKPCLVKNFSSSVADIKKEHIFSMLVEYSDHCRKIKKADGFKFYIDGQQQFDDEVLELLPLKQDQTLQGYHLRMEEMFEDYCLVCDELLQVSQENSKKIHDFTQRLFSHVGFPNRFAEIGLYLGNYRQTPFGVHVDGCGVFSFPVVGEKTFRLWTPAFAEKHPELDRSHEYSKFKKNSEVFKAGPGDMTYWPSSAWHIAESDGSFSATWSLGVWVDRTHQENIETALRPLLKSKLNLLGQEKVVRKVLTKPDGEDALPPNYIKTISRLRTLTENELHDAFLKTWMELNSKQGLKNAPLIGKAKTLSVKSKIQIKPSQTILWSRKKSENKMFYAFQGTVVESSLSPGLLKLVKELNQGKVCMISEAKHLIPLRALANAGAFV